jgi:S-formylglutathione hydrolase
MKRNKILFIAVCVCVFQFLPQHIMGQNEPISFPNNLQDLFISEGTLKQITVHSKALENNFLGDSPDRKVTIYLPPGYDNAPDTHYPVIYLLHGWNGNNNSIFNESEYGYRLKEMLDALINRNLISPFIVASPSSSTLKYYGSWYTNSTVTGNWEDFIVRDLVNYTDSNYRTLPESGSRGITGHSMGGFGAMKTAMIHPDIFSSIYSMSGLLDLKQTFIVSMKSDMLQALKAKDLNGSDPYIFIISAAAAFSPDTTSEPFFCQFPIDTAGSVIDSIWSKWLVNDPYTMVPIYKENLLKLRAIQFGCGTSEILEIELQNDQFSEVLTENGIEHLFMKFMGDHMTSVQEQMKSQVLPFFSKNLDHSIPGIYRSSASIVEPADTVVVEMDTDGSVYIVPDGTLAVMDSIIKFEALSSIAPANTKVTMPLNGIAYGEYVIYGVDTDSAVSIPLPLVVVPNASPPNLTVENYTVPKGDSIRVTSNKDGKIYLVFSNTTPDRIPNRTKDKSSVISGKQVSFATSKLIAGTVYWLFAVDTFGIHSDAYPVRVDFGINIEENSKEEVKIYPNPANNTISIITTGKSQGETLISIFSINGRLILRDKFQYQDRFEMDVSNVSKGIYLLRIQNTEGVETQKLVLQ